MDRRQFLTASLLALTPGVALAQTASPPPPFPPVDARSVWLVGDAAPPDPVKSAARLAQLVQQGKPRDSYLAGGAVAELEKRFATMLGKEDCAFLPTGTLANHVAVRILAGEATRVIVQHESHLYRDESDAVPLLSGLNLVNLAPGRAGPTLDEIKAAVDEAENGPYPLKIGAISLESPVRRAGGEMLAPPSYDIAGTAALFDTVYVSLYKYLDAPFGAVLAGSKADIAKARALRHQFGGTIYQAWPAAVLALAALDDFQARQKAAFAAADQLFAALDKAGAAKLKAAPNASNIRHITLNPKLADGVFDRMRVAGVRLLKPQKDGTTEVWINDTLTRRPVDEYVKLFLG
ncbi:beta-eliminating lyase-related protein [Caulobacter sp.]|uniref:beta-eliminating lyase-related protein n=1 Tax=Caulobacter sp. TaxID=78 RepID=UPI0016177CA3